MTWNKLSDEEKIAEEEYYEEEENDNFLDGIDFPDMVRTCSRYRGYQCGAEYAEGFKQCQVYLKGTTKRLLP